MNNVMDPASGYYHDIQEILLSPGLTKRTEINGIPGPDTGCEKPIKKIRV
jgi:hypothetical protein